MSSVKDTAEKENVIRKTIEELFIGPLDEYTPDVETMHTFAIALLKAFVEKNSESVLWNNTIEVLPSNHPWTRELQQDQIQAIMHCTQQVIVHGPPHVICGHLPDTVFVVAAACLNDFLSQKLDWSTNIQVTMSLLQSRTWNDECTYS